MYSSPDSRHWYVLVSCTIPTRMYPFLVVCTRLHLSPHSSVVLDLFDLLREFAPGKLEQRDRNSGILCNEVEP